MSRTYRNERARGRHAKSCRNHGGCPWCYGNRTFIRGKNLLIDEVEYAGPGRADVVLSVFNAIMEQSK